MRTGSESYEQSGEAEALANILEWSKGCPLWQRDALRRLCTKGELNETDIDQLTARCMSKGKDGIALTAEHIPDPESTATTVNLRAVNGVKNVNALREGECLTFSKSGLTIVYGDNGSGKSGYARILKKVCRARVSPKEDRILPNIYTENPGPQEAVIDFSADDHNATYIWTGDHTGDARLSSISIFDRHTANIHVDEANEVAYTPFTMYVLEQLAVVCQEVKRRIDEEIRKLDDRTPAAISRPECRDETAVGKLMTGLGNNTKEPEVRGLATLNEKDKARLETLKTDFRTEPAQAARRLKALKNRLDAVSTKFETMLNAVGDEQISRINALHAAYQTAKAAAAVAADKTFAADPLPDIGSEVWRALWEAARRYSEQHAYPAVPFPFTDDSARCVLCQQELDAEAADRLKRFELFVRDDTKRKEEEAAEAYHRALKKLVDAKIPAAKIPALVALFRDELNDAELAKAVRHAAVTVKWRLRLILRKHVRGENGGFPSADAWPAEAVTKHSTALLTRIVALRAEDESEERKQMRTELEELEDRAWLAVIQDDVIAEICRRKKRAALHAVFKDTTTNRITVKSGEIADRLVISALCAQFSKEVDKFDIVGLATELRKKQARYGVPRFKVSLAQTSNARVGDVLSEGEHRCVALAAFLAELATTESRSTIVFDDPVSSLDHIHRAAVAERIAEESRLRQVIVFTHDIAFMFLLDQACRKKDIHIAFRSVTRTDDQAGFVQHDPPTRAKPIEKVIEGMQKKLDNEKRFYENGDNDKWETMLDAMEKRLRTTWERAVEEVVGPVIKRFSNKVETKGLAKVTTLTIDDCTKMRQAYARCSPLLHSDADVMNPCQPRPEDVQSEITELKNWVEDIQTRQSQID